MRSTNTFGIQFITRPNKAQDGLKPIYVRITVDGRRIEISLKRWIKPADWNRAKGMARGSRADIKSLNHYLEEVKTRLMECYQEMQIKNQLITADAIKGMFLGNDQKEFTLCKLMDYHNKAFGQQWCHETPGAFPEDGNNGGKDGMDHQRSLRKVPA